MSEQKAKFRDQLEKFAEERFGAPHLEVERDATV
jgi:hypothetical protein